MSDGILISGFHSPKDLERRMKKVDVIALDLGSCPPTTKRITNITALKAHLESEPETEGTDRDLD